MAIDFVDTTDLLAEMETEVTEARTRAANGNVFFFKVGDGEKALVRFLLDLGRGARVLKHEFYNPATNKYEVSALCTASMDLGTDICAHCLAAKTNKKLTAVKYFIVPVFVYGVKNSKTNEPVTYKDKDNNVHPVSGIRLLQLKGTSPLLATLIENYREHGSLVNGDVAISLTNLGGDKKKPNYTVMVRPPSVFTPPDDVEIPEQSSADIIARLIDLWSPAFIDESNTTTTPPAQQSAQPVKAGAVRTAPDF